MGDEGCTGRWPGMRVGKGEAAETRALSVVGTAR